MLSLETTIFEETNQKSFPIDRIEIEFTNFTIPSSTCSSLPILSKVRRKKEKKFGGVRISRYARYFRNSGTRFAYLHILLYV